MTILITGASGFVGAWLAQSLAHDGLAVVAQMRGAPSALFLRLGLDRHPRIRVLANPDLAAVVAAVQPTAIYHLAGMSQIGTALQSPVLAYEANARATWLMLDALRVLPVPPACVVASTDSIYGETGGTAAVETDPLRALGPYEVSKIMADLAARSFAQLFRLPIVVARLGNVYGPGDANGARIIPAVLAALRAGDVPRLRGGGRAVRGLLHVDDCVAGLRALVANAAEPGVQAEAFNLSGAPPLTTLAIVKSALAAFGRPDVQPLITEDAPGETSVKISSTGKLRARLGWQQQTALADGLTGIARSEGWGG